MEDNVEASLRRESDVIKRQFLRRRAETLAGKVNNEVTN